jgi:hypothetical protein
MMRRAVFALTVLAAAGFATQAWACAMHSAQASDGQPEQQASAPAPAQPSQPATAQTVGDEASNQATKPHQPVQE